MLLLVLFISAVAASKSDEITELPGLNFTLNYKQYSGYLSVGNETFLHYWFVESQSSPSKDPVVLWLSGGPGCSSLEGLLVELGPLHVSADGKTLYNNTYSWNREANVIFLETPAGVGFSYTSNGNYNTNDDATSYINYVAIQKFFQKFPEFKKNDFYITGESYAGVYIPTLSLRVLTGHAEINFKGFAIGNGVLDIRKLNNSLVFFAYYHGLVGNGLWGRLTKFCCNGSVSAESCEFSNSSSKECNEAVEEVNEVVHHSGLNPYNLYSDCVEPSDQVSRYEVDKRNILGHLVNNDHNDIFSGDPPCIISSNIENYLNQPSVRKALHIPIKVQVWAACRPAVQKGYTKMYDTVKPQVLQLIKSGKLRGLIYNGDVDMVCNFLGDEWFTYDLGLKAVSNYEIWKYNSQVAGFVKYFENLTFLTVKGSGHMVPQDKPGPAFHMISNFLNNKPY